MFLLTLLACAANNAPVTPAVTPNQPVAAPAVPDVPETPTAPATPTEPAVPKVDPRTPTLAAEQLTCSTADECVPVQLTCCDHCNGGLAVVVNQGSVDAVRQLKEPGCENMMCTEMACAPVKTDCIDSKCVRVPPPAPVILK